LLQLQHVQLFASVNYQQRQAFKTKVESVSQQIDMLIRGVSE